MERNNFTEFLRMVLIAFAIAFVINLVRVLIFQDFNIQNILNTNTADNTNVQNINYADTTDTTEQTDVNNQISPSKNNPNFVLRFNPDELDEIGRVQVALSPRINLSGKSRSEIFELRKQAVNSSRILDIKNYEPDSNVYNITDNLPWISASGALYWSKATDNEKVNGPSRDSIGILNPELLYYVSLHEYSNEGGTPLYKPSFFVPYKVLYRPDKKRIVAYIKNEKNQNGRYEDISLCDANAHDLGFNYAYMDMYENIGFYNSGKYRDNTLASGVKPITGYYTHGSACGIPGGCNNYAPYWQYYNRFYVKDVPAKLNIKLWKQKPNTPEDEADFNFKLYFY